MDHRSITYYREKFRPQYHFSPERNFINDPCGLVHFAGEYHLFYQYNPFDLDQDPNLLYWGHAISDDLLHWRHMPLQLGPDDLGGISTGCGVVDWHDTSGLFGGQPGLVLIYVYVRYDVWEAPALAFSRDRGRTWHKLYDRNPLLDPGEPGQLKDAKVFWHAPTERWVMVLTSDQLCVYSSPNLLDWRFESAVEGIRSECPDLFELPVDGDEESAKWVLTLGGRFYHLGAFDGRTFTPETGAIPMNFGPDAYASQSWSDAPGGRRIMIDWMMAWRYARRLDIIPTRPWNGSMSLPRELTLRNTANGVRLFQNPIAELVSLRALSCRHEGITVREGIPFVPDLAGTCVEIEAEFRLGTATRFGLEVMASDRTIYVFAHRSHRIAGERTRITYDVAAAELAVDRRTAGTVYAEEFAQEYRAPLAPANGRINLHVLADWSSVETIANRGQLVISTLVFPTPFGGGIRVFARGGAVTLERLRVHQLGSVWNDS